jgi:hypothetical protein
MAKATSRKHATHRKARTHHAAKTHTRRSSASSVSSGTSGSSGNMNPVEAREAEIVDDESTARPQPQSAEQDTEEEIGIYGASRGESAGENDEATS